MSRKIGETCTYLLFFPEGGYKDMMERSEVPIERCIQRMQLVMKRSLIWTIPRKALLWVVLIRVHRQWRSLVKWRGRRRHLWLEPTGDLEDDPTVTDKKSPGNLTRSYRSKEPLRIIGEAPGWKTMTAEKKRAWVDKIEANKGVIIN